MLDIRLLGSPIVTVNGDLIDVDTKKAIALLAYLAIEGSAERDALSALFWADSSPERARATLRRTLSALRTGIGAEAIGADRQRVTLAPGFTSDVTTFNALVDETSRHDHEPQDVCNRCIEPLTAAAALYRGDFLGSFYVRAAPDFEDWARPVAESLRIRVGEVFERLALAHAANGDYTSAIDTTARWISLDELHEPAHRQSMLLHAWAGDRPGAMQAYRDCVAVLDRELGVAPLEETTELFEAILDEDLPPAPALRRHPRTVRTAVPPTTPDMIDRSDAMTQLTNQLLAGRDTGRTCLITGNSWMGKTRLLEYLAEAGRAQGHTVVTARAFRAESELPYGVATQLLQHLVGALDETGGKLAQWATIELARLDPTLAPGQAQQAGDRQGQLRVAEAFLDLVGTISSASPLLVSVDDTQWIDAASASLIAYVQRRMNEMPVLLVLSSRSFEMLPPPLDEVGDEPETTHLRLEPLTVTDLEDEYPDVDLESILAATGGIPLLTKETLDSGISPDSASVLRYMESRRSRLSDLARQVLAAAAVLDGLCDAGLLRDTSGRTDDEIVEAVEELILAGLMREEIDGHLSFTLDVLETVTYDATSLTRRRLLHRRAADAFQARPRSSTDARLATATARHLRAAGSDDAAEWYRLSGDLSRAVFAHDEAAASYEMAIALGHNDVGGLHVALGELAMARGDYQEATRELRTAASHTSGADLALVEHRMGDLSRILGRFQLAEESYSKAGEAHPDPAELYADWALLRHRTGDGPGALSLAEAAVEAAERGERPEVLARAVNILGVVTPDSAQAMTHLERALVLAASDEPARMAALNNKAHLLADAGEVEAALVLVGEAIEIADRSGYRHRQAALLNHLADLHHQAGNVEAAEDALTEAVTLFADIASGDWEPEVWLLREW